MLVIVYKCLGTIVPNNLLGKKHTPHHHTPPQKKINQFTKKNMLKKKTP